MTIYAEKSRRAGWLAVARIAGRLLLALSIFLGGYLLIYRPQQLRWGATDQEVARAMPGDQIQPQPIFNSTRAVTIGARPEQIWPWLVQMGYKRAGFYGYDALDNAGIPSADHIIPGQAYTDPHIEEMVTAIRTFLTQMRADPARQDEVVYRFDRDIRPEEETKALYTADHVLLIKRGSRLVGYAEINRDTNAWLRRDRYEGDILVDPAAYERDEEGQRVEKGIGEQGLLEMRRQGRLLRLKDIELDVYLGNQPMHHFLDHLIATHRLPFTKHEMTYGRPLDSMYLLSC